MATDDFFCARLDSMIDMRHQSTELRVDRLEYYL